MFVKHFFSGLKLKLDVLDLNLDDFKSIFQSQSISELRRKMIQILKDVFQLIQHYSVYFKKIFYISSLVLIFYHTYRWDLKFRKERFGCKLVVIFDYKSANGLFVLYLASTLSHSRHWWIGTSFAYKDKVEAAQCNLFGNERNWDH